jgi:hypothetical protein
MADYIRPVLAAIASVLQKYTPGLLAQMTPPRGPFLDYLRAFTGQVKNPPSVWVMPGQTQLAEEGTTLSQQSLVTVKIGVLGSEPEDVMDAAQDYVRAVSDAILMADPANDWGANILKVFPQVHHYGPLFEQGRTFARFPEVHLSVSHEDVAPQAG